MSPSSRQAGNSRSCQRTIWKSRCLHHPSLRMDAFTSGRSRACTRSAKAGNPARKTDPHFLCRNSSTVMSCKARSRAARIATVLCEKVARKLTGSATIKPQLFPPTFHQERSVKIHLFTGVLLVFLHSICLCHAQQGSTENSQVSVRTEAGKIQTNHRQNADQTFCFSTLFHQR